MQHLDRTTLEHYAQGKVLGADAHRVELHLERCALCMEAVEGLRSAGASLPTLENPHRGRGSGWPKVVAAVGLAGAMLLVPWLFSSHDDEVLRTVGVQEVVPKEEEEVSPDPPVIVELPTTAEINAAVPIVAAQQIGHAPRTEQPPIKAEEVVVPRDTAPPTEPLEPVRVQAPQVRPDSARASVAEPRRDSRRLVFLHDLKLVHPDELYGSAPQTITDLGVSARFATPEEEAAAEPEHRPVQYLDHFDGALAAFARNDHKRALTDLRIVLTQYPDDVNALFYAGLSCYNLGMFAKSKRYFDRAAAHPVSTFDQEARWYFALGTERADGLDAAIPLYEAIALGGGFYSAQAMDRIK